jgi:L-lactate permease
MGVDVFLADYPPSKKRKEAVYGLVFGGIGLFAVILGAVLLHDFKKKVGYFKRKEHVDGKGALLHKGEF